VSACRFVQAETSEDSQGAGRSLRPEIQSRFERGTVADEIVGWSAAAALLVAFGLAAAGTVRPSSATYLLLNLCGASGLARVSLSRRAYPPAVLNLIWAAVAAFSLVVLLIHT
jgi:hypothetical protein